MARPYKFAHDLLRSAIGSPEQYGSDWRTIAGQLEVLVTATGFDKQASAVLAQLRDKVGAAVPESLMLRAAADAQVTATGPTGLAGKKRALALKTLRHLYYFESFGKQRIWVLSLPQALQSYPIEFATSSQSIVTQVLDSSGEQFGTTTMKDLAAAAQVGLAWLHRALIVVGAPDEHEHRKLLRRWFIPANATNEREKLQQVASTLRPQLQKIAAGLRSGEVILTDSPEERETGSSLEKSEAFVFAEDDLVAVHIESAFFSTGNTLTGKANWARILVHELSHSYAKTKDYSYSWQGLLPRETDILKRGIDARILATPGWKAGARSISRNVS